MSNSDPLIHKKLGDYTIKSLLGRGGMARVYTGYDENLDRYAAVKVIDAQLIAGDDREEYYQRFQREARAIARLNHPNIVGIYQFGKEDADYYMAMVFIEGEDLRHILKRHNRDSVKLPHKLILQIMRAMASALDYAHAEGVIHRDIKPSNILVTKEGNAVLTDFGLALSIPEGTLGNTFGSAHYIAPEQAVSSAQAVAQSDLYSLGVCLYEMLTGRVPFDDDSAMSVALKHLSDIPPPPSQLNADISPQVEQVIMKALEKEPQDRYQSGADLVDALEEALQLGKTTPSSPTAAAGASSEWTARPEDLSEWSTLPDRPSQLAKQETSASVGSRRDMLEHTAAKLRTIEVERIQQRRRRSVIIGGVIAVVVGVIALFAALQLLTGGERGATATAIAALATEDTSAIVFTDEATEAPPTATDTEAATETESATDTPTEAATETESATDTPTEAAAETESVTDTPQPTDTETTVATEQPTEAETELVAVATDDDAVVVQARYDDRTFVLYNNSGQTVDVSDLVFELDGTNVTFSAMSWRPGSASPEALPNDDCFQIWTTRFSQLPPPGYCDSRHAWRSVSPDEAFWLETDTVSEFLVRNRVENTELATCEIAAGRCDIALTTD